MLTLFYKWQELINIIVNKLGCFLIEGGGIPRVAHLEYCYDTKFSNIYAKF